MFKRAIRWVKDKTKQFFSFLWRQRARVIKWAAIFGVVFFCCYFFGFTLNCFVEGGFELNFSARLLFDGKTFLYTGAFCLVALFIVLYYYYTHYWLFNSKNIIKGNKRDKDISANLEQAHFQTENEIEQNFQIISYDELPQKEIKGIPIRAYEEGKKLKVTFSPPTHTLVIGTTGSGKRRLLSIRRYKFWRRVKQSRPCSSQIRKVNCINYTQRN